MQVCKDKKDNMVQWKKRQTNVVVEQTNTMDIEQTYVVVGQTNVVDVDETTW